ncbi:hypothetical protein K439DRAFT_1641333 [Ramaria rubella]|nr:hypothetical protein K439DRAFT_1641333 [Ramaria rubella]
MTFIPSASSILSGKPFSLFVSAHVAWPLHMISFSQVRTPLNNVCVSTKKRMASDKDAEDMFAKKPHTM